ncbi:unnamed protein product [Ostreobium quekettii]|uniref:Chloride channel protein n=1 Tax=Ostreobium quekettii TaxID=121088 RepID=A0A8S1ITS5_9CHLO|nr:unnamed protein product [Ostreobium quekettii]|eukprot:evm.model.scf_148EXC.3 EVM.evm.TU.scf_148EXC.3   scf_148EXC:12679-15604(-)
MKMKISLHIPSYLTVLTWFYCLLIGLVTGAVAFAVSVGVSSFFKGVWAAIVQDIFSEEPGGVGGLAWAYAKFAAANLALVLSGAVLVLAIAPVAAGSGIPNMYAYLNGIDIPDFLNMRTAVAKVPASVLVVSGGLAIGKEGPLLHIGSIIATWFGNTPLFTRMKEAKDKEPFAYEQHTRDLVLCGAAAGLAAGFKAPIGGVLFAMEMASRWRPELTWRCLFTTAATATVIRASTASLNSHFLLDKGGECKHKNCDILSYGSLLSFSVNFTNKTPFRETGLMIILGILGGLLGSLYTTLNTMMIGSKRWGYRNKTWARLLDIGAVSVLTSVLRIVLPWMGHCLPKKACDDCPSVAPGAAELQSFVNYGCDEDSYNDLAALMFNPQGFVAKMLFQEEMLRFTGTSLFIFTLFYYLMAVLAYGGPIPAGLFTPSLITGGALGQLFAWSVNKMFGMNLDLGLYAFLGAASLLGGMFRFAVSFCVVLVELFESDAQIPFLILVLVFAKGVGDRINQSILNHLCILLGLEYVGGHPDSTIRRKGFKAKDIAAKNIPKLHPMDSMENINKALDADEHGVFPIVRHTYLRGSSHSSAPVENFIGMVSREDLEQHLEKLQEEQEGEDSDPEAPTFLLSERLDASVDLTSLIQLPPVVLPPEMPLTTVFRLKNASGIEYLPVVGTHGPLQGLISRHELVDAQNKHVDPHNLQQRLDILTKEPFLARAAALSHIYHDVTVPLLGDAHLRRSMSGRRNLRRCSSVF